METKVEYEMQDAVFKAKEFVESQCLGLKNLKWIYVKPRDSYNDDRNRIGLYVLEGEPPRGVIIANYCLGVVMAFDIYMTPISKYEVKGDKKW